MEILYFPSLPSTSTYAAQLAKEGKIILPFAVRTDQQTAGRGRQGRSWLSPEGGLYLSLALPSVGQDPLRAAGIVAEVIEQAAHLRVTLKWPNDLLVNGKKLGGILCESSLQGDEWGPTIVGIGINLKALPSTGMAGAEYLPTSLSEESLAEVSATALAEDLCRAFEKHWAGRDAATVHEIFERYSVAVGQVFSDADEQWVQYKGLAVDGGACFTKYPDGDLLEKLHSVAKSPRWSGQVPSSLPQIICDIGNTTSKCAVFRDSECIGLVRCPADKALPASFFDEIRTLVRRHFPRDLPHPLPLFVGSVNPPASEQIFNMASSHGFLPRTINKVPRRVWGQGYDRTALGVDRLAAMEGLLQHLGHQSSRTRNDQHLLVSAGTALTFDILSESGEHLGGMIAPGLRLMADSLAANAALLPRLEPKDFLTSHSKVGLPANTQQAIASGIAAMVEGAVLSICSSFWPKGAGPKPRSLWITGGDGEVVHHLMGGTFLPNLALEGLRTLVFG